MFTRHILPTALVALSLGAGLAPAGEATGFPPEARRRYDEGSALQKKGQLDEAVRAFEEAIQLGMKSFPRVHLKRADANLDLKKYDTAIAQYTKFIEEFGLEGSCRA